MVGTTHKISVPVYLIAPKPTATPPTQPTTNKIILINPKRLNSNYLRTLASKLLVPIFLCFCIVQRFENQERYRMIAIRKKTDFCQKKRLSIESYN